MSQPIWQMSVGCNKNAKTLKLTLNGPKHLNDDDDDDDNNNKQIISYNYVYILLYVCYPIYFIGTERNKNYL